MSPGKLCFETWAGWKMNPWAESRWCCPWKAADPSGIDILQICPSPGGPEGKYGSSADGHKDWAQLAAKGHASARERRRFDIKTHKRWQSLIKCDFILLSEFTFSPNGCPSLFRTTFWSFPVFLSAERMTLLFVSDQKTRSLKTTTEKGFGVSANWRI